MSEYKSLDQWFPDGRGDGRKFTSSEWDDESWIEPIFKNGESLDYKEMWHCLDERNENYPIFDQDLQLRFKEWHPPKETKKITMYKPVFKHHTDEYFFTPFDTTPWSSDKHTYQNLKAIEGYGDIVGWMSQEIEVDDEN